MLIDEVEKYLNGVKDKIVLNIKSEGINASGRTAASVRVERYAGGIRLLSGGDGTAPLQTLEIGREAGKVPFQFHKILVQWSRDKGITFESEGKRSTFAYFLGKKIAREGTARHKSKKDVYSTVTNDAVNQIKNIIFAEVKESIKINK